MDTGARARVLVVGGGVAGIEALLGRDAVELTLLAPGADFSYRPLAVGQPFATAHPLHVPLCRVDAKQRGV